MRKVLFCSQTATPVGGVPQRLGPLSESLPRLGWEPIVALAWGLGFHDPDVFRARHPGLTTLVLDGRSGTRASRLLALERTVGSVEPDVVVPLHLFDALEAVRRQKCVGKNTRLVFGIFEVSPPLLLDAERYAPVVDGFVANSRLLCELLVKASRADPERVHHIPQGIPPPVSRRDDHREGPLRIGYFGRLSEDKRVLDLVGLCAELDARAVRFSVLVVGEGPLDGLLRERTETWRRRGAFEVRPATTRRRLYEDAYPAIDVSVLFSPREGSPNLPLESMAHGVVPVVADFQGRSREGFLRSENALVFPVGDIVAAANCIERLSRDAVLRETLAARGVDDVTQRYGVEQMVTSWARALDRAIEGPSALGDVAVGPFPPSGRLERWLGARGSEAIRRLLRRRFAHPDAGEWPYWGGWGDGELRRMDDLVQTIAAEEGR